MLVERIVRLITDPVQPVDVDRLCGHLYQRGCGGDEGTHRPLPEEALPGNRTPGTCTGSWPCWAAGISTLHPLPDPLVSIITGWTWTLPSGWQMRPKLSCSRLIALEELFERRYAREENSVFTALVDSYGGQRTTPHCRSWS